MLKQKNCEVSYLVTDDLEGRKLEFSYLVILKNLDNTAMGCPRYEARIVNLKLVDDTSETGFAAWARVYRFTGHYHGDEWEAKWIVEEYIKRMARND